MKKNLVRKTILHVLQLQIAYVHRVSSTQLFSWFNHNLTHSLVTPCKSLKPLCLCSYTAAKSALQLITKDFFDLTLKELVNPCPCQPKSNLNYWTGGTKWYYHTGKVVLLAWLACMCSIFHFFCNLGPRPFMHTIIITIIIDWLGCGTCRLSPTHQYLFTHIHSNTAGSIRSNLQFSILFTGTLTRWLQRPEI